MFIIVLRVSWYLECPKGRAGEPCCGPKFVRHHYYLHKTSCCLDLLCWLHHLQQSMMNPCVLSGWPIAIFWSESWKHMEEHSIHASTNRSHKCGKTWQNSQAWLWDLGVWRKAATGSKVLATCKPKAASRKASRRGKSTGSLGDQLAYTNLKVHVVNRKQ